MIALILCTFQLVHGDLRQKQPAVLIWTCFF